MKTWIRISLILLLISSLRAYKTSYIGKFLYINSIVKQSNRLVVATDGGVFLYNLFDNRMEHSLVTQFPVKFCIIQNLLTGFFVDYMGNLYRWDIGHDGKYYIGSVGAATSLGVCCEKIYIENNGSVIAYSTSGIRIGPAKPEPGTYWVGKLNSIKRGDDKILFLQPYFFIDNYAGRIDMSYFYKNFTDLWVGTRGKGIYKYDMNLRIKTDSIQIGLPFKEVHSIISDGRYIFIGGENGLIRFDGKIWMPILPGAQSGLFCPNIIKLGMADQRLIIGTECDIEYFGGYTINRLYRDAAFLGTTNGMIIAQRNDRIYFLTIKGAVLKEFKFPYSVKKTTNFGNTILILANGRVFKLKDTVYPLHILTPFSPIYSITAKADTLFVLSEIGLLQVFDGIVEKLADPFRPAVNTPYPMVCVKNKIVIGGPDGLYIFNRENKVLQKVSCDLPDMRVKTLTYWRGNLYVGTPTGLCIIRL